MDRKKFVSNTLVTVLSQNSQFLLVLYLDKQLLVFFWAAAIYMFVYLNVWLMLNGFQDVWQTAATSFPRNQQLLTSSSSVQCLGLQNT